MSEEQALLTAIGLYPQDDTPRLVYADWLQERDGWADCGYCRGTGNCPKGDGTFDEHWHCPSCNGLKGRKNNFSERAELIRAQIELHNKPCHRFMYSCHELNCERCECPDGGRYDGLRARAKELIDRHPEWRPTCPVCKGSGSVIPAWVAGHGGRPNETCRACSGVGHAGTFRRGLVEEVPARINDVCQARPSPPGGLDLGRWMLSPWAAHVLKDHPTAEFTCAESPWGDDDGAEFGWWEWGRASGSGDSDGDAPPPLVQLLWAEYPKCRQQDHLGRWLIWGCEADARDAMGWALTEYARRESG